MKNYNIGLDIGTTSVGWAVVNPDNYKIMRKGNKSLWGVRLFDEATTAELRRNYRNTRRRYDRRRERIKLLQEEFKIEINKVDNNFFTKLKESFYQESDTERKTIILTKEEKEKIKKYNDRFPTIYHLREKLINNNEKEDIRLVYLAIHHIIKYRGNFLYNGNFNANNLNIKSKLKDIFEDIYSLCGELELDIDNLDDEFYSKLAMAVTNKSKNDKKVLIKEVLNNNCNKNFISEFTKLILGNKFSLLKMLNIELDEDINISFKEATYEDKYSEIEKVLEDKISIIDGLKELYDMIFLKELFGKNTNTSISSLMVDRYIKHKEDLSYLKQMFKCNKEVYKKFFKNKNINTSKEELCLYQKYINNKLSYYEFKNLFTKELERLLNLEINSNLKELYLLKKEEIENGAFLPRITDTDNGKYPYQLNKEELIKIIENQGKYYPFLLEKVNDEYKLVKLLSFKIPYYVGPLSNTTNNSKTNNPNAWLVRKKDNEKITPYNFDEIVDKEATAEKFVIRMISHCTYLLNEYAIPNNSILYSKYKVMNELKQIKINNRRMTNDFQHQVYNELFLKTSGTITESKFINYLKFTNEYGMEPELKVEGYSDNHKFANNMQSYIDFFGEHGIFENTNYTNEEAEEIIEWVTILEDKDILETKIRNKYDMLSNDAIKKIIFKKYKGWSNLSKKLLTEVCCKDKVTGINKSIMDLMYETPENFMQILNNKEYNFQREIDKLNKIDNITKINYSLVENLAASPATKRGIYQALKVVDEIVDYMGYGPDNIMIEMARGEEKVKNRNDTRKNYINNLYNKFKEKIDNYNKLKEELDSKEKIDSEKMFLYFIQEGKSLYSGTPLNINNLDLYEVDHIIPRTLIKDNSIDNKALVLREENQNKAANFVLPSNYRNYEMIAWWKHLKECNLISNKKLNNLQRKEYSTKDIEGFINRQLVETRQITKHVANILNNLYKNTKIIYLHADLSHNYRDKYELFKYRELNDYHHAHDAYLAAVLGEYKDKYLNTTTDFDKLKELSKKLFEEKRYKDLNYGYVINSLDNEFSLFNENTGEILFDADEFNKTIEDTLYRNDILISKKMEIKTGEFYNQTKNKKGQNGVSLKGNLPTELYGSYTSLNPSYAIIVKYISKNKIKQRMIGIPICIDAKNNQTEKINYIAKLLKINDISSIEIIKEKIPFYSIINWDGQLCSLVGATSTVEVCNCKEFNISKENQMKWKYSLNRLFNYKKYKDIDDAIYSSQLNEILYYVIEKMDKEYKLYNNLLEELKGYLDKNAIDNYDITLKEKTLLELFKLLKFNSACANLKHLNSKASIAFGKKNDRVIEHAIIINKSVTGLKERRYEF